jgi:hypothetical protein
MILCPEALAAERREAMLASRGCIEQRRQLAKMGTIPTLGVKSSAGTMLYFRGLSPRALFDRLFDTTVAELETRREQRCRIPLW